MGYCCRLSFHKTKAIMSVTICVITITIDNPCFQALKEGSWVLLDELNLAPQSVLEVSSCKFECFLFLCLSPP